MDIKFIVAVIVFVILLSLQYTLNNILRVLIDIKNILKRHRLSNLREEGEDDDD